MATNYFGSLLGALGTGDEETAYSSPRTKVSAGLQHARLRTSIATIDMTDTLPVVDDTYRFFTMKSSDRIYELWTYLDSAAAATNTVNFGTMLTGDDNDGAVIDEDLFYSLADVASGEVWTDNLHEAGTVPVTAKGMPLWEMCALGAASYTVDPVVNIDITGQVGTAATNGGIYIVRVVYASGA